MKTEGPVRLVRAKRFGDARGWFTEVYNETTFAGLGITCRFVQDNHSYSQPAFTLRGLHLQAPPAAQDKLVRCTRGRIFDVAVDIRKGSPTYGNWVGRELSAENGDQLFVPVGFAHGFVTLVPDCEVMYKCSALYSPAHEMGVIWNDPRIGIAWPFAQEPLLSAKDAALPPLAQFASPFDYDGRPLAALE
jgi:dTDP-4-dehydrorhamnose 3,5-epimerase